MAIEVEGYRELQRAFRKAADTEIPKRIGQAHKRIGDLVISRLPAGSPEAVGRGAGSTVRSSASKREVLLRVGGRHRAHADPSIMRRRQWGKTVVRPFQSAPQRPHIMGTVRRHRDEIIREFKSEVLTALRGTGGQVG